MYVKCFARVKKCLQCIFVSTEDKLFFFQESIDNNKSIRVTIYTTAMSNSGNYKKHKTFEVSKLIYFKKPPLKKVLTKLRVLSDTSLLLKCWFYKKAPQKVLIELSPGVCHNHIILIKIYILCLMNTATIILLKIIYRYYVK